MNTSYPTSRRAFLQRSGLAAMAVAGGSSFLAACASGGGNDDDGGGGAEQTEENPFGVQATAPLSVVIFNGGYGDEYAKFHEAIYQEKFADAEITHKAITDIRQQMQPLFNAGNPPDVLDNAGAEAMPISTLADTGQLADLTDLFEADAIGSGGHDGPGHASTRSRSSRRSTPTSRWSSTTRCRSTASGTTERSSTRRAGSPPRPGPTSSPSARRSRAPGSRRWRTRASTPTTSSRC